MFLADLECGPQARRFRDSEAVGALTGPAPGEI